MSKYQELRTAIISFMSKLMTQIQTKTFDIYS
jgi:hypothetical protein